MPRLPIETIIQRLEAGRNCYQYYSDYEDKEAKKDRAFAAREIARYEPMLAARIAEIAAAEAIVREIAEGDPINYAVENDKYSRTVECWYCGADNHRDDAIRHADGCLWVRSCAIVAAMDAAPDGAKEGGR